MNKLNGDNKIIIQHPNTFKEFLKIRWNDKNSKHKNNEFKVIITKNKLEKFLKDDDFIKMYIGNIVIKSQNLISFGGLDFEILHNNNPNYESNIKIKHTEKESNMNVPYVRVNNQKEFERVVAKMERETGLRWEDKSSMDNVFDIIGVHMKTKTLTLYNNSHPDNKDLKIISADEYLTGIRENFTLGDLEDGMVVEYRNGEKRLFVYDSFIGIDSYGDIENYNENFSHNQECFELDVVKIYKLYSFKGGFDSLFDERNLTLIFDAEAHRRNKYKILQRKYEIENEMAKLQEELKSLEVKNS